MGRSTVSERVKTFREKYEIKNPDVQIINMIYDKAKEVRLSVYEMLFFATKVISRFGSLKNAVSMLNFADEIKKYGTYEEAINYMKVIAERRKEDEEFENELKDW